MKLDDGIDKEELNRITGPAKSYARYGALGIQMVATVTVFILCGHWLDGAAGLKTPWFTVLGVFMGVTGALWFLFQVTRKRSR